MSSIGNQFLDRLVEEGYTHCFFLAGGNIMHLLNGARTRFDTRPFVHEVGACIAAEYFNMVSPEGKAFVLVTAGPGLTNLMTGLAGAWLESRELLVVGGQVKSQDLSRGRVRQNGIQEIDGVALVSNITSLSRRIESQTDYQEFWDAFSRLDGRKGPVFVEWCLDIQASSFDSDSAPNESPAPPSPLQLPQVEDMEALSQLIQGSERPLFLIGSGLNRDGFRNNLRELEALGIPMLFTWNAADYLPSDHPLYRGRPNTWGQLHSNLVLQQCDLLVSVGARLGLQATGFAWEHFVPIGKVVQVDIDDDELSSEHPKKALTLKADAMAFLSELLRRESKRDWSEWAAFSETVKTLCPKPSALSSRNSSYIQPQSLMEMFGRLIPKNSQITPSSSGGAFTVSMQCLELTSEMRLISNKGLASMGYGLSGAIGMAIANPELPTICVEGDGGFAQNIQELGTVAKNSLNLKIFVFSNGGYASIRMTQRNYFDGAWVGCDSSTGLGLPDLRLLAESFGLEYLKLDTQVWESQIRDAFADSGPMLIEVPIDPEQTYLPKIGSKVAANGGMVSNPLHRMDPRLTDDVRQVAERFLIQRGIS